MRVYCIRHVPTGALMPARMFRTKETGFSWWDPTNPEYRGFQPKVPRLFLTRRAAELAKTFWLKGPMTARVGYTFDVDEENVGLGIIAVKDDSRKSTDLEIVLFELAEPSHSERPKPA